MQLTPPRNSLPYLDSLAVDYLDSQGRLAAFSDTGVEAMFLLSIGCITAVVVRR